MAEVELDEVYGAGDVAVIGGDIADFDEDSEDERDQKEQRSEEGEGEASAGCGFNGRLGGRLVGCSSGLFGPVIRDVGAYGLARTTTRDDFWKSHKVWRGGGMD